MTNAALAAYYADLLILQYKGKPKAYALVGLFAAAAIMDQLPTAVLNAYAVETAVGPQLDVLGKYVGALRSGYGSNGPIVLDDDDFRLLIKLAIIRNNSGSSLGDIQGQLHSYFGSAIQISDSANMSINYAVSSDFGSSDLQNMIVYQGFLPKPMGVSISVSIVPPGGNNFFNFRTYGAAAPAGTSPLNAYGFYNLTYPWITY